MIPFWKKETGNLMSHVKGLTEEQIAFLQTLKVGDRLIIWDNATKPTESRAGFTLRLFSSRKSNDNEF